MQLSRFRRTRGRAELPTIMAKHCHNCHNGGLHHELLYLIQEPCKTNRNDMERLRLLERTERHEVLLAAKRATITACEAEPSETRRLPDNFAKCQAFLNVSKI